MSTQNGRKHRIIRILNRNKENKKMITHKSRIYKWNGDRQMDKRICRREREKERVLYDYIICEFMCVFFFPKEISNQLIEPQVMYVYALLDILNQLKR